MQRRDVLRAIGALGGLGLTSGRAFAAPRVRALREEYVDPEQRVLVLLQLTGGNDGLSMVVPDGDDAYHSARSATRHESGSLLRIDEYRGLHPSLERLHARYHDGGLAIVEGVGYPSPNRSHFKSLDIWHTADQRGRNAGEGWIGRLCSARYGSEAVANRVVHVGGQVPYALHSTVHPPAAFSTPAGYRWMRHGDDILEAEPARPSGNEALDLLRDRMRDAQSSSRDVRSVAASYRTPIEYPDQTLAGSLRVAAALVNGAIGTRVVSVALGGFDTHVDQRPRHERLMNELDGSLCAFLDDLARTTIGRQAVVLVFSEFGRRVAENGSKGTDHGSAGPMFVAGAGVRGGLFGSHPSLTELDEGDLVHTTDFRSVYAAGIEACFDVKAERVLGERYPRLRLF